MITPALLGVVAGSKRPSSTILLLNFQDSVTCEALGTVLTITGSAAYDASGKFGKCININGTTPSGGGTHKVASAALDLFDTATEDFYIECWFAANDTVGTSARYIVSIVQDPYVNNTNFALYATGTGGNLTLGCLFRTTPSFSETLTEIIPYDNDFHHMCMSVVGTTVRFTVDGVVPTPGSDTCTRPGASAKAALIGNTTLTSSSALPGKVDAVRIGRVCPYDMVNGFTPPTTAPTVI